MKHLMLSTMLLMVTTTLFAQSSVILSQKVASLKVDINTTKLKLSALDYSMPTVKVLVPDLAKHTLLDHRNTGEGAPCLATFSTFDPQDVIQNNPQTVTENFIITLVKKVYPDKAKNECQVTLIERVEGYVRGFKFTHERQLPLPHNRHIDDCQ